MMHELSVRLVFLIAFCTEIVKVASLDDGMARTPIMGWNSWNAYAGDISEDLLRKAADNLIDLGLSAVGYKYVNIDDGWSELERCPVTKNLVADKERFPRGIKALAGYMHSKGLKIGIYGDAGAKTCLGYPGSRNFESHDASTWASWGIDYLKFDNCYAKSDDSVIARYKAMRDALKATNKSDIIYSLCEWGVQDPWLWADAIGHSWRTTADITPTFQSILSNLDGTIGLSRFAGPGRWNDPDMLEIGNGDLTPAQERSHFALWVILKAPLLIGADLDRLNPDQLTLLKSKELIEIHQDQLGVAGDLIWKQGSKEVYATIMQGGDRAVVLFNRHFLEYEPTTISITWTELGLPSDTVCSVRDVLNSKDLGDRFIGQFSAHVGAQDVVVVRISPKVDTACQSAQHQRSFLEEWRPWHGQIMYSSHDDEDSSYMKRNLVFNKRKNGPGYTSNV